jgi:hypothetical protein
MQHYSNTFLSLFFALFVSLLYLGGCDDPETAPAYIYIDTVSLNTTATQGSNSQGIKTVWLSLNGQSLGAYELPTTIPILANGTQEIVVEAGIANSGVLSNRVKYPFYRPQSYTLDLVPLQTLTLSPEFDYQTNVVFDLINDFEFGYNFSVLTGDESQVNIIDNTSLVFEGDHSLHAQTYSGSDVFAIVSNESYSLPIANAPVYVEMNYRCEAPFYVTLRGFNAAVTQQANLRLQVNAKDTWNKIYIDVEPMISELTSNFDFFQVIIGAELPDSLQQAHYWFDNVKLVHQ